MSEIIKVLSNIRSLRVLAREVSFEQLEDMLSKLTTVVEERREEAELNQAENEERQRKLQQYREMLINDGIDPNELFEMLANSKTAAPKKAKRTARPAKYEYTDENGELKTWTGQGRTPAIIKQALDAGQDLENFAITAE
ncbi:MAG: H-NS family nucleoid-associated regulatory protein [Plesiomonas sp.]|uniref:H-NS family histone-like protein n=1 Tax=Plesiomonas sp. TaxID=2486279 RepID=UPI003F2BEF1F